MNRLIGVVAIASTHDVSLFNDVPHLIVHHTADQLQADGTVVTIPLPSPHMVYEADGDRISCVLHPLAKEVNIPDQSASPHTWDLYLILSADPDPAKQRKLWRKAVRSQLGALNAELRGPYSMQAFAALDRSLAEKVLCRRDEDGAIIPGTEHVPTVITGDSCRLEDQVDYRPSAQEAEGDVDVAPVEPEPGDGL